MYKTTLFVKEPGLLRRFFALHEGFFVAIALAALTAVGCTSAAERPEMDGGAGNVALTGKSLLKSADVTVIEVGSGNKVTGQTGEDGTFSVENVTFLGNINIVVCGGKFFSSATATDIFTDMCLTKATHLDGKTASYAGHTVDFVSTFVAAYSSSTSSQEWESYLGVSSLELPKLDTSLTDATKIYLWTQGFAQVAKKVSEANGVAPEATFSTQVLFAAVLKDLKDNNKIDGSTKGKFGDLDISGELLRNVIADYIPNASEKFSANDLKAWLDGIRNSKAKFLGAVKPNDTQGPVITIVSPSTDYVAGEIAIKATAADETRVASLDCTVADQALTDTNSDPKTFEATFDTTALDDGPVIIKCHASDGLNVSEKAKTVTVKNKNEVTFAVYVAEPVSNLTSIDVYNLSDLKLVTTFQKDAQGNVKGSLPPGSYVFETTGGQYITKVFDAAKDPQKPVSLSLYKNLIGRGVVESGKASEFVLTPLTTAREYLYRALLKKGDPDAENKSRHLLEVHFKSTFDLYVKPSMGSIAELSTQYYMVLAALEQLALDVSNMQGLSVGTINVDDIVRTLDADLPDALLDGNKKHLDLRGFTVDSYLFRYWYAVALKYYIENNNLNFNDFQDIIYNISMDTSELFPVDEAPREVVDQPPQIINVKYQTAFTGVLADYDKTSGAIPYSNDVEFSLDFRVVPGKDQLVPLDEVVITGADIMCDAVNLNDATAHEYSVSCRFDLTKEDGQKEIDIAATDQAGNHASVSLTAVKDTVKPVITITDNPTLPRKPDSADLKFTYALTDTNLASASYSVSDSTIANKTLDLGGGSEDLSGQLTEGSHTVTVTAKDKAAQVTTETFVLKVDATPPAAAADFFEVLEPTSTVTKSTNFMVAIDASKLSDNFSPTPAILLTYKLYKDNTVFSSGSVTDYVTELGKYILSVQALPPNASYKFELYLTDEAGNVSQALVNCSWNVDQVSPTVSNVRFKSFATGQGFIDYNEALDNIPYVNTDKFTLKFNVSTHGMLVVPLANIVVNSQNVACDPIVELDATQGLYSVACALTGSEGSTAFSIDATDNIGNTGTIALKAYKDSTDPALSIFGCPGIPRKSDSQDLQFTPSFSDQHLLTATYTVTNSSFTNVPVTTALAVSLASKLSEGSHLLTVTVTDKAGNITTSSCTLVVDNTPPGVQTSYYMILIPSSSPTSSTEFKVYVDESKFQDNFSAQENIALGYKIYKDTLIYDQGSIVGKAQPQIYELYKPSLPPNASYKFELYLTDEAGNVSPPLVNYTWTIDTMPPLVSTIQFKANTTGGAFVDYNYQTGNIPYSNTAPITLKFRATGQNGRTVTKDHVDVASTVFECDPAELVGSTTDYFTISCKFTDWAPESLATFKLSATDNIGNTGVSDNLTAVKDLTPPVVTVSLCPANTRKSSAPDNQFKGTIDEANPLSASYTVGTSSPISYVPGQTVSLSSSPLFVDGLNAVTVTALDKAGNSASSSCTIRIDNLAPSVTGSPFDLVLPSIAPGTNHSKDGSIKLDLSGSGVIEQPDFSSSPDTCPAGCMPKSGGCVCGLISISKDGLFWKTVPFTTDEELQNLSVTADNLIANHLYEFSTYLTDLSQNQSPDLFHKDFYYDTTPPPMIHNIPAGYTTPVAYFHATVSLGSGDATNPNKVLYPPTEVLKAVTWQDGAGGSAHSCTKTSNNTFDCYVDLGASPPAGVHDLYFFGFDAVDNVETNTTNCGDSNFHCLKVPVNFDLNAPVITGFTVTPAKTTRYTTITWDLEANTTYTCAIKWFVFWPMPGHWQTVYDCSANRAQQIDLLASITDGFYTVELVATKFGRVSSATKDLLLDHTPPVIDDPYITADTTASFEITYYGEEISNVYLESYLTGRTYFDITFDPHTVRQDSSSSFLGHIVSDTPTFIQSYNKNLVGSGGVYDKVIETLCDQLSQCTTQTKTFGGSSNVKNKLRAISDAECNPNNCIKTCRTINYDTPFQNCPKGYTIYPCDTCITNIVPTNVKLYVMSGPTKYYVNSTNMLNGNIPLISLQDTATFTFPATFDSIHYPASVTKTFNKTSFLPVKTNCYAPSTSSPPFSRYTCEYALNDIDSSVVASAGCYEGSVGSTKYTADYSVCKTDPGIYSGEKVSASLKRPTTFAIKYCTTDSICVHAYGKIAVPIYVEYTISGESYNRQVWP